MKTHQITSHDMTWHLATNHITSPHVTSQPTALLHRSLQPTTSKQVTTSPPWNGWRLVDSNNSVWASQWLVTLCTFYRQILSLTYSFCFLKLPPPACPALLVFIFQRLNRCTSINVQMTCAFQISIMVLLCQCQCHMSLLLMFSCKIESQSVFQAADDWAKTPRPSLLFLTSIVILSLLTHTSTGTYCTCTHLLYIVYKYSVRRLRM